MSRTNKRLGSRSFEKDAERIMVMSQSVTAPAGSGGHIIQDEGTSLTQRSTLNFTGAGVSAADSGGKTVVTISGASSGNGRPNFVPVTNNWDYDTSATDWDTDSAAVFTTATKDTFCYGSFRVPGDFSGTLTIKALIESQHTGAHVCSNSATGGVIGASSSSLSGSNSGSYSPASVGYFYEILSFTLTVSGGEIIELAFERDGNDGGDSGGDLYFLGWTIAYS